MPRPVSRRRMLALLGGGTIVAASTASAAYLSTRTPTRAIAPWAAAGGYAEMRRRHLSYAILAPNPHNMQPWTIDLAAPGEAMLHVDRAKLLPHTDPANRQITIGLGCFLEMLRMAAAAEGRGLRIEPFPEGESAAGLDHRPVARIVWEGEAPPDPLFAHAMTRQSLKEPYDTTRPVPPDAMARIAAVAPGIGWTLDADEVAHWRAVTETAMTIELRTPRTWKESVDVFRIGKREVNASPDGIDFSGAMFEALHRVGQFDREVLLDQASIAYAQGEEAVLQNCRTAMGHMWLVSPANGRRDQLASGAAWLRMNLAATAEGIATQPLSQALQEYPEMAETYDHVHARLAPEGGTVQMFARVGYGAPVGHSPRWPLEAKLLDGGNA
ncbi:MAG: Acg family FMN-binding oxidoreductase [Shimia sp.]